MQSCQHQELIRSRSQMQQMVGECKRNWAIKFLTKHLEGCRGKWEERQDWRCMRGLKEPRRKDTEWLENKKCPSQQYVLAYGYTCSNATLIMQSCLPCQLTGLVVQKMDFAYSDTVRTDSHYHQHGLDAVQPRSEKRQRTDKRREKNWRENEGGTHLNWHRSYCVAKCGHIAMQCFKNTRKILHSNTTTAMQKPKKMTCPTMNCLKKCTTSSPSWEYRVHKSIVAWGKSSQLRQPLYTERNLVHHFKDHTLLHLHLPTSKYGQSKASLCLEPCTASVIKHTQVKYLLQGQSHKCFCVQGT